MGAVFAFASGAADITAAHPDAVASGTQIAFAVAALLIAGTLAVAIMNIALLRRATFSPGEL
ncbi:hypothetical protein C7U61_17410 [Rhizobium sp. JAB6]|nr:hypothetical protein C7U61_17410 [Rhizobium sp. JAB6]